MVISPLLLIKSPRDDSVLVFSAPFAPGQVPEGVQGQGPAISCSGNHRTQWRCIAHQLYTLW